MDNPNRQIFLSYSRPDQDQVEQIAIRLDRAGYRVWYDQAELVPGDVWSDKLDQALRNSSHCLVCIGPGAARPWQREEVRTAINRAVTHVNGFRVVPILLPDATRRPGESELPSFLTNRHWVEFKALDDRDAWDFLYAGLQGKPPGLRTGTAPTEVCPYKGLDVFDIEDAPYFFGRDAVTGRILSALRERISSPGRPRFYAIIGPSGTGKSSLARAGVLAHIKNGQLGDCGQWFWPPMVFKPGDEPLSELAKNLMRHEATQTRFHGQRVGTLVSDLRETNSGEYRVVADEVDAALDPGTHMPILIDQFEEALKPLSRDNEPDRDAQQRIEIYNKEQFVPFVQNLAFAARQQRGRVVVIATMRDDFYGRCGSDDVLRALVQENHELLGLLSMEELNEAVERPARASGKAVEPGLLSLIEKDMSNRPGALPLLQESLEQLWHTAGNTLTARQYNETGGIAGSLANKADETYRRLTEKAGRNTGNRDRRDRLIRQIFLDLVYREGPIYSSRRRPRSELPDDTDTDHILETLVNARLLLQSGDKLSVYYELAHEALIVHWPQLKKWLQNEDQDDRLRRQMDEDAMRWHQEREQHKDTPDVWQRLEPDFLLKRKRWERVEHWLDRNAVNAVPLGEITRSFIDRCKSYIKHVRRQKLYKGMAIAGVLFVAFLVVSGYVTYVIYRASANFIARVVDENGETADGYQISVNDIKWRWFPTLRLRFLQPDETYRIEVEKADYYALPVEITPDRPGSVEKGYHFI
jgi:hypothetical protein